MSSAPPSPLTPEEIAKDATWLAQALDPGAGMVRLIAMNRESYRAASFLDDRMLQQPVNAQVVAWPDIEAAFEDREARSDARWIFHIGHVGSTLVSRLLGEIRGVLAVREPRILRDVAVSPPEVRAPYLRPLPRLMSRTFAADELACVKATSFASEIAPELVPPGERALFMYASSPNYIASILAGENSVKELRALEQFRTQRLAARGIEPPTPHNDAERAAVAWACEMTALDAAQEAMADRLISWVDFDRMLANMRGELDRVARFFGFDPQPGEVDAILAGPLMGRYSKALEHEYSPSLRADLIEDATRRHAREIDAGLALLKSAAEKSPLLARASR